MEVTPHRLLLQSLVFVGLGSLIENVGIDELVLMTLGAVHMTVGYLFVGGVAHVDYFNIKIKIHAG